MISVFVQGVPNRGMAWERCKQSLGESDAKEFTLLLQPPDKTPREFFLSLMARMAEAPTELVVRIEDDAIVNKHLLHNFSTWDALEEPDFGGGWGFVGTRHRWRWNRPEIHGSVVTLFKRADVPAIAEGARKWFAENPGKLSQDLAMSRAIWGMGKRVYIHDPPLAEHPLDTPSTLGHLHNYWAHTTQGRFEREWRRET